jgi:hypothetical protein
VAPSSRKQETLEAANDVVVVGTEAYSKLSSVLSTMSGGGQIWPCTEELVAPVLFMDQIARMKNGSIVSMSQTPSMAAGDLARDVDDEGLEWWVILLLSLGGACLCLICSICQTLFILDCLKKRHEKGVERAPSNSSLFSITMTSIGKQLPKSPRQTDPPRSLTAPPLPVLLSGLASSSEGKLPKCAMAPSGGITLKQAAPVQPEAVGYQEGSGYAVV